MSPVSTRAASNGNINLPHWKNLKSCQTFHFRTVTQYNAIQTDIRQITNKQKFKKSLSTFIKANFPYKIYNPLMTFPMAGQPEVPVSVDSTDLDHLSRDRGRAN